VDQPTGVGAVGCSRSGVARCQRALLEADDAVGDVHSVGVDRRHADRCEVEVSKYAHTAAPVLGPRAATPGVAANSGPSVDVSSTANCAASTGRVPGLLGALSSSPVHRAFVLVLGTNIAVFFAKVVYFEENHSTTLR